MVEKLVLEKSSLLIDVGNSSIKSVFYQSQPIISEGIQRFHAANDLKQQIEASRQVFLSNVGKNDITASLQRICNDLKRPLFIAQSKVSELGLTNAYGNPSNMGVDRWLAMLACIQRSKDKTLLVADIGTAMTIDAVVDGNHIGGWITPGLKLLRESLFKNTQRVFGDDTQLNSIEFGNDTPLCVDHGCRAQIIGTFLMAENIMRKKVNKFDIFITGGNKNIISEYQKNNIIECENLVLEGLTLFVD